MPEAGQSWSHVMKNHSFGAGAMLTKTESSGTGAISFLQELRSPGYNRNFLICIANKQLHDFTFFFLLSKTISGICNNVQADTYNSGKVIFRRRPQRFIELRY